MQKLVVVFVILLALVAAKKPKDTATKECPNGGWLTADEKYCYIITGCGTYSDALAELAVLGYSLAPHDLIIEYILNQGFFISNNQVEAVAIESVGAQNNINIWSQPSASFPIIPGGSSVEIPVVETNFGYQQGSAINAADVAINCLQANPDYKCATGYGLILGYIKA